MSRRRRKHQNRHNALNTPGRTSGGGPSGGPASRCFLKRAVLLAIAAAVVGGAWMFCGPSATGRTHGRVASATLSRGPRGHSASDVNYSTNHRSDSAVSEKADRANDLLELATMQFDDAREELKTALKLRPDFRPAQTAMANLEEVALGRPPIKP